MKFFKLFSFLYLLVATTSAVAASERSWLTRLIFDEKTAFEEELEKDCLDVQKSPLAREVIKACPKSFKGYTVAQHLFIQEFENPYDIPLSLTEKDLGISYKKCRAAFMKRADLLKENHIRTEQEKFLAEKNVTTKEEIAALERDCFNNEAFKQYGDRLKQWMCYMYYPEKALENHPNHTHHPYEKIQLIAYEPCKNLLQQRIEKLRKQRT